MDKVLVTALLLGVLMVSLETVEGYRRATTEAPVTRRKFKYTYVLLIRPL